VTDAPPFDLLAFGPHPDDVELFCGGTVADAAARGHRVAVVDLTEGEAASRGTPEIRRLEAASAAALLGVAHRENLQLPDAGLRVDDAEALQRLVACIRRLRPALVLAPWRTDRHPDHTATSALVTQALFLAALVRWMPELGGPPHTVREVMYYPMRVMTDVQVLVDISHVRQTKRAAIAAHASQVGPTGVPTLVSASVGEGALEARDAYFGAMAGVAAAEGFVLRRIPILTDPVGTLAQWSAAHFFTGPA
jgi:bacillithiol biosynthesis deacetylase BshB1